MYGGWALNGDGCVDRCVDRCVDGCVDGWLRFYAGLTYVATVLAWANMMAR